jgi:hypothetical protein
MKVNIVLLSNCLTNDLERRILSQDIVTRSSQYFEELADVHNEKDRLSNALINATNGNYDHFKVTYPLDFLTLQENAIRVNQGIKEENDKLKDENDELQYTVSQLYKSSVNELKVPAVLLYY